MLSQTSRTVSTTASRLLHTSCRLEYPRRKPRTFNNPERSTDVEQSALKISESPLPVQPPPPFTTVTPISDPDQLSTAFQAAVQAAAPEAASNYLDIDLRSSPDLKLAILKAIYKTTGRHVPPHLLHTLSSTADILMTIQATHLPPQSKFPVTQALKELSDKGELPSNVRVHEYRNKREVYAGLNSTERKLRMLEDRER